MTPTVAGMRIARSVTTLESELDNLLAKSGELLAEVARARVATDVEAHTMQQPLARVANVQRALVGARSELVRAHRDLSNLAQKMDLGVICPKSAELIDGAPHHEAGARAWVCDVRAFARDLHREDRGVSRNRCCERNVDGSDAV